MVQLSEFLRAPDASQKAMSTPSTTDAVVYVVDDNQDVQSGLKHLLEFSGLVVRHFRLGPGIFAE